MKVHDIKDRLVKKAKTSHCRYRVAALGINDKGVVVSSATNSHRIMRRGAGLHAEMQILRRSPKNLKTIIIARVGNSGILRNIKPCTSCKKQCEQMGIKIVSIQEEL